MHELLLERTDGLPPHALAAFIDGWGSMLRILERADLVFPDDSTGAGEGNVDPLHGRATRAARDALAEALRRVRAAQDLVLGDDPLDPELS